MGLREAASVHRAEAADWYFVATSIIGERAVGSEGGGFGA